MSQDYAPAQWLPSPNYWAGRPHGAPRWLILHGTGSALSHTPADEAAWFANPQSQVSAHYIVGRDGSIAQCVREADTAWSNGPISGAPGAGGPAAGQHDPWWDSVPGGNPNYATIAIEHVNDVNNSTPLSPAQKAASFALIRDICTRNHIPMRAADAAGGITGHYSMDPLNRAYCPGAYPWTELWASLSSGQGTTSPVSTLPPGIPRNPAPLGQLNSPTKDGQPDEDKNDNCGEDGLAWIVRDIGNEPDCVPDEIHDEVLGQGVIGGSDLLDPNDSSRLNPKYVAAAMKRGIQLTLFRGTQAQLIAKCHEVMGYAAGDVLANFGGGSQYLNKFADPVHFNGFGHICVIAHSITGGLELMDPWIGGWRDYTDADLQQMIVWGYIVIATPLASVPAPTPAPSQGAPVLNITDPGVAAFFSLTSAGTWHCKLTNFEIMGGILAFYRANNGVTALGMPISGENYPTSGVAVQVFERGVVVYDPARKYDSPPGASGDCYLGHIDSGTGLAVLEAALQQQLASAQATATKAQSDLQAAQAQLAQAQADLTNAKSQAASDEVSLQQQLTAAQAAGQQAQAAAQAAQTRLDAATAQIATLTQQVADAKAEGGKGVAVVEAIKAALA